MTLPSNALTILDTVKDDLDLAGSTRDARLTRMIAAASDAIEAYCQRPFGKATVTEKYQPSGTPLLCLNRTPILSITQVKYDGAVIDADSYEIEDAAAGLLRKKYGVWPAADLAVGGSASQDGVPGTGRKLIEVTYVGGYVLPKDATNETPRTLPYTIEQACLMTVTQLAWKKGRDLSITNELDDRDATGKATVGYRLPNKVIGVGEGGIIPDEALPLLADFRRMVF